MSEKSIDVIMLQRIDQEQKATASRVDKLDANLQSLAREVSEVSGKLKPANPTPWWLTHVLGPLCVASAVATVGAVIILLVKVNGIETFIHDNGGFVASLRLEKVDPQKAQEAEKIISQAKKAKVTLIPTAIEQTGKKFVDASSIPQAWSAALQLAVYQRSLNANTLPPLLDQRPWPAYFSPKILMRVEKSVVKDQQPENHWVAGYAPAKSAATIEPFTGQFTQSSQVTSGAQFIIVDWRRPDLSFVLANIHLKNVIIRNAKIRYSASPLWLENVYFVNCTFDVVPEQAQELEFARALLIPSSVTFRAA